MKLISNPTIRLVGIFVLVMGFIAMSVSTPALAKYPDKNIRVIIHVSPGGGTDTMARLVLRYAGEKLGTKFVIENHKGAGGQIGYTTLSMAKPDGYTIGTITTMSIVTHELTRKNVAYQLSKSFAPIARVVLDPSSSCVLVGSPYKTLGDLVDAAKKNPGKINWGGTMLWGSHHVHMALVEKAAGIKLTYIPFDGAAELNTNILGGHLDVGATGISEFAPLVKQGKLRCLAVGSPKRMSLLPDAPTYKELGYDVEIGSNRGFAAPAGTPQDRIDILSKAIEDALQDPAFIKDARKVGIEPTLSYLNAQDFKTYLLNLQDTMRPMLKDFKKN